MATAIDEAGTAAAGATTSVLAAGGDEVSAEGGEGDVCARAIASRANAVIDVNIRGSGITAAQPVAVVTAIAQNMPH